MAVKVCPFPSLSTGGAHQAGCYLIVDSFAEIAGTQKIAGDLIYALDRQQLYKVLSDLSTPPVSGAFVEIPLLQQDVMMQNLLATGEEITGNKSRTKFDLTSYRQVRVQFMVSTASTSILLKVQYSQDQAAWTDLLPAAPSVAVANALSIGAYADIPSAARADVYLRAVAIGNGLLDPVFRKISLDVTV